MEIGYIKKQPITKEMEDSYLDYAMSVIVSRALPDVRDGLKPVHRRILYAMHSMGLTGSAKHRKSATVVGECFVKDTLVLTDKGLIPIQDIKYGDKVYTQKGTQKVTQLYEMPKRKLLKIVLKNGISNTVTLSQKFKVLDDNLRFKWKEAKDLTADDYLVVRAAYPKIKKPVVLKETQDNFPGFLDENLAYFLGLFMSDGWISEDYGRRKYSRIGVCSNDRRVMDKISFILEKEFKYSPTIEEKKVDGYKDIYSIRVNRKDINDFFLANFPLIKGVKAHTKFIPLQIFQSPKNVIFAFISGLIEGDGSVSQNRNLIHYGSVSERLVDKLLVLFQHQGIFGTKLLSYRKEHCLPNKRIIGSSNFFNIEIRGENAVKLAKNINLVSQKKHDRVSLIRDGRLTKRKPWSQYNVIPYAGNIIFGELSACHLGGGWYYSATEGAKFRMGIKYPAGQKIRYSLDLLEKPLSSSQIISWGIKDKLKKIGSSISEFLEHVIKDDIHFLKISNIEVVSPEKTYDLQVAKEHEFLANGVVSHNCLGKYHPHGDMAVYDSMVRMAQNFAMRYPLVDGQGNFGCFTGDTKVRLTDGRSITFKGLIKEAKEGKRNWTFSFNSETGEIEIVEIKNPRLTRRKEKIMEVILDNGEKIRCTLDHLFMTRDGLYKKAKDLKTGESLMPLYTEIYQGADANLKGYETVYQPLKKIWNFVHRLADKWNLDNALNYFNNFSEILSESRKNNHKVIKTKVIRKREDVYDLTVEPYHNFSLGAGVFVHNSLDGDSAAASRYTEARMTKIAGEMVEDIEKETVDWVDNYDGTRQEPVVLPAKLPQLLLNGGMGIAVGMSTDIPPHNLSELVDGIIYLIDHPKATVQELCQFIKGPDFPTGGIIYDRNAIIQAYSTGRGPIVSRAKAEILERKAGQFQIIVTEMTYRTNKAELITKMADLIKDKRIEGIKDLRDESDKDGVRIAIDLKNDSYPQKILNRLFKLTDLQKTYHLNMLALVNGLQPQVLSLKEVLEEFVKHRQEVIVRRTKYGLKQAKERAHILEGLSKALDQIDAVIKTIKKSPTREIAHKSLMGKFKLSDRQATAILEMRLQTLAGLEQKKIKDELKEKKLLIKKLEELLKSPKKIMAVIKKELQELKDKYGDERRTKVFSRPLGKMSEEELIPDEECVVILTQGGYIKRVNPKDYRTQKRGGKGVVGIIPREEDAVGHFLCCSTHDDILFFTDRGRVFQAKAYEIPQSSRTARGQAIVNILSLEAKEAITAIVPVAQKKDVKYLFMATKNGIIKRTKIEEFGNVRRNGLIAINLRKDDRLKWARLSSGQDQIILTTIKGQSIRFNEKDARPMGRTAAGVKGIQLRAGDEVVKMDVISLEGQKAKSGYKLLVITENGFGKRTEISSYKIQKRGGMGIKTAKLTAKTGDIVDSRILKNQEEDLIVISRKGQVIRTKVKDISVLSRTTQGVRIMKMKQGDKAAYITCV